MDKNKHIIYLDLKRQKYNEPIVLVKGDTKSIDFNIVLTNNSLPVNFTNTTAKIFFEKEDKTSIFQALTVTEDSQLTCTLSNQANSVVGTVCVEVALYGVDGEKLTSVPFSFTVRDSYQAEAIESSNDFQALTSALTDIEQAKQDVEMIGPIHEQIQGDITTGTSLHESLSNDITTGTELKANLENVIATADTTAYATKGEINTVSSQLNDKAKQSDLLTEKARIDNLVANNGSQTIGNSELIDIRVGADGKTYSTSGEATRANDKRLMDVVLKRNNNLLDPSTLELGDIGSWGGSTINTNSVATDKIRTKPIEVIEGNSYMFVRNGVAMGVSVFSLFDTSGNYLQAISAVSNKYTIPTGINAKYIRARFSGTDVSLYNGDNSTTTLQFKLYSVDMLLTYEKYGYSSILTDKTTFDSFKSEVDGIIYFDDQVNMAQNINQGVFDRQTRTAQYTTNASYQYVDIPCVAGDRFLISGYQLNDWNYPVYMFTDGATVLTYNPGSTPVIIDDLAITAPTGATHLYVNNDITKNVLTAYKLVPTNAHAKLIELQNSIPIPDDSDIIDLQYENKQLKNRVFHLESMNPFDFNNFDKGYITFVFDDGRHDVDKVASIFAEYGLKLSLAIPPTELNKATDGINGSTKKVKDVCNDVVVAGGEVLCHSMTVITSSNINDEMVMAQQFKTNKKTLEDAGFNVRGIIMAGGTGQLLGGTSAEGGDIFQKWSSQYYDYSDRYGMTPNYYHPRANIKDGSVTVKSSIATAITNKTWLVYCGHTLDGTETGNSEAELRSILQYCVDNSVSVVTYAYMYDTFGTTALEKRIAALEV